MTKQEELKLINDRQDYYVAELIKIINSPANDDHCNYACITKLIPVDEKKSYICA